MKSSLHPSLRSNGRRLELFVQECYQKKQRLKCAFCNDILIQPHQRDCGCRFCLSCLEIQFENPEQFCLGCKERISSNKNNSMPDKAIEKEISNLWTICVNKPCPYQCKLKDLFEHTLGCDYRETRCKDCHESYQYKDRTEHHGTLCKLIKTKCEDCGLEMTRKDLIGIHKNVNSEPGLLCDLWKGLCPLGCSEDVLENIKKHLDDCGNKSVECVFRAGGCSRILPRKQMERHITTDVLPHWALMIKAIGRLKEDQIRIKEVFTENHRRNIVEVGRLNDIVTETSKKLDTLRQKGIICKQEEETSGRAAEMYKEHRWKIDKITTKIIDAKEGHNRHFLSEPFYSDKRGYKIRLKIYPNGDGAGSGSFISLYFVIMKGEFDDEIQWPFRQKLSISILSTKTGVSDRTVNMMPDSNESCYGRPRRDCNLGAGLPKFISHSELLTTGKYLNDDIITVRTRIL